ncbi:DUF2029 domain-containing protein [bacterium]|nr:MAG: DUF2029 domain-containing protein [bacterium]
MSPISSRAVLTALAAALVLTALATAPRPARERGVASRDFEAYWSAGRAALAGHSPYDRTALWLAERGVPGVDAAREELLPFVSPPPAVPLFAALARLPYEQARRIWLLLLVACCGVAAAVSFAVAGWRSRDAPLAALIAITFSPLTATLALGQLAGLAFAVLALAVAGLRNPAGSGLALACSALQPNLAIAALAGLRRSTLGAFAIAAMLATAAAAIAAAYAHESMPKYAGLLLRHGAAESRDAIQISLPSLLATALPHAAALMVVPAAALTLVAVFAAARAARLEPRASVALACALLPLAAPFFHADDLIVLLLPAAFALRAWQARGALLGALGVELAAVNWLNLAQQPASQREDLLLAAAAACAVAALHPSRRALWLAAPALLALALAPLAAAHPVPLWPDALPQHFHVPGGLDAAAAWAREQQASGLTRQVPLWTLLRALPLAGCALLAAAIVLTSRAARRSRTPRPNPAPVL